MFGRPFFILHLLVAAGFLNGWTFCSAQEAIGKISLPPGFEVEEVYRVPVTRQGSWVAITVDPRGRIIASDQHGRLYQLTPAPIGRHRNRTRVRALNVAIGQAQGLACVGDDLYVVANGGPPYPSGLYKISDSNKDKRWDRVEQLRIFRGSGEHGPHAVVAGPDGKSLYFCCGNATRPPLYSRSLAPPVWAEDQLLPRLSDPKRRATNLQAPGGWIARTDLDGNALELHSIGFRNQYDLTFNSEGELFTFDADMEWDIGTPWYRPTRICHVTSGVDFGWRPGNGKWRPWYIDSLPAAVDIGPGSATGVTFGYGTKFPEEYQEALFAADWGYGRILAVHLTPDGSTYTGTFETFARAMPLAVTDMVVRPQDGALYFTVGGRKSASGLYRIVYNKKKVRSRLRRPARPADAVAQSTGNPLRTGKPSAKQLLEAAEARDVRREIEALHGAAGEGAVDKLWPHLASSDRAIRSAARIALEHQPTEAWLERAWAETNPTAKITAVAAAARVGRSEIRDQQMEAILQVDFAALSEADQRDLLRTMALTIIRLGPLPPVWRDHIADSLTPQFPTGDFNVDREMADVLVSVGARRIVTPLMERMESAISEEAIDFAISLSAAKRGWTLELRERMLDWFVKASEKSGGGSSFSYLEDARNRFLASLSTSELDQLEDAVNQPLAKGAVQLESESRPFVKEWNVKELVNLAKNDDQPRNFERGQSLFAAASCYQCHRLRNHGSTIGPNLMGVGWRFGLTDLLRAIVEPSHQISDQYQQMVFKAGGKTYVGRITDIGLDEVRISTNILDPKSTVTLKRSDIDEQYPSDVSLMPKGLLNTLDAEEVLDLLAFLRASGAAQHAIYEPSR